MSQWPRVPLGDVLTEQTARVGSFDANGLPLLGVSNTAGLHRSNKPRIADMSRYLRVQHRWFAYNPMRINVGSIGWAEHEHQTGIISPDYVVFSCTDRIEPQLVFLFLKSAAGLDAINLETAGSVRERLFFDSLARIRIALPPVGEQRQMVARIEELVAQIHEARVLRRQALDEAYALVASHSGDAFRRLSAQYPIHPLRELTSHIVDGPHVTPSYLPEGAAGIPFVTVKNMVTGELDFSNLNYVSIEDHRVFTRRCRAERGDVLYSKDGATRGRPCFVDTDREFSYFVSVALIKPLRERLDGPYVVHLLNSNWIKDRMGVKSRGDMIPHIVLREIRAFPVPLPPLHEQRRIVAELNALQAQVDAARHHQSECAAEIDSLLPAILDRAFRGDL